MPYVINNGVQQSLRFISGRLPACPEAGPRQVQRSLRGHQRHQQREVRRQNTQARLVAPFSRLAQN